jgi:hypothetical protein
MRRGALAAGVDASALGAPASLVIGASRPRHETTHARIAKAEYDRSILVEVPMSLGRSLVLYWMLRTASCSSSPDVCAT